MKLFFSACVVLALSATVASAQDFPIEKYTLPNGMTVILSPDHSAPLVTVNTWFKVGSRDEPEHRNGFAHLFEHLMFMGTKRVPTGQFDKIMEGLGGSNNASTEQDRTNYFSTGPSNILKTLLWLDADRLQDLGKMMDQKKLDLQRQVVLNERRQTTENTPYGKAEEAMPSLFYPLDHPYHNSVIGNPEDLNAANVYDVKRFFATYYVPNNASLVVVGDFDPAEIKPYIALVFGTLPRGNDVVRKSVPDPALPAPKHITMVDTVSFPKVYLEWHSPGFYTPDDGALNIVASILGDGESSRLYRELVDRQGVATEVSVSQDSELLGSNFEIQAVAAAGVTSDALQKAVDAVVQEFLKTGPTADEVKKAVASQHVGTYRRIQNFGSRADLINEGQFYTGNPMAFLEVQKSYDTMTPASLLAVARKYIATPNRLELHVIPAMTEQAVDPRDTQPSMAMAADYVPAKPTFFTLGNGAKVIYFQRSDVPLTEIRWLFDGGTALDPKGREGLTSISAEMLDQGTKGLGAAEFEQELAKMGADFSASATVRNIETSLSTLTTNLPQALDLAVSAMKAPTLDADEFATEKRNSISEIQREGEEPSTTAMLVANREYYGVGSLLGRPANGTTESVTAVALSDVKARLAQTIHPANAEIVAIGNLDPDTFKKDLEASFGLWQDTQPSTPEPAFQGPAVQPLRVVIVDRPNAPQTVIRWVMPGLTYSDPTRNAGMVVAKVLGGSFTSRLNQNLREDKGYTYGAFTRLTATPTYQLFAVNTAVRTNVTGDSLKEVLKELKKIGVGDISVDEVSKSARSMRADEIDNRSTEDGLMSAVTETVSYGEPYDASVNDVKAIAKLSPDQVNAVAKTMVRTDTGVLILVGDKDKILPQLAGLGLPAPVEVKL